MALLEIGFLVKRLPAWSANLTNSGLHAHLLAADAQLPSGERALFGQVLEGFVVAEVDRQSADGPAP
jgi:hypothetical protein